MFQFRDDLNSYWNLKKPGKFDFIYYFEDKIVNKTNEEDTEDDSSDSSSDGSSGSGEDSSDESSSSET